jgi:hypothetical protein
MHATRLTAILILSGVAGLSGCSSVGNMAERTALAEAGLLETQPGSDEFARYYRYYPGGQVYFNPWRSRYYWMEQGKWTSGAELPASVSLGDADPVVVKLFTPRPYSQHQQVIAQYPPASSPDAAWAAVPTSD